MHQAKLKERHLDRILAEELEASPAFARWLVHFSAKDSDSLPAGLPSQCSTHISYHRTLGETDIRTEMSWATGETAVIHIEDKLGAHPQPDQARRYQVAIQEETADVVASLLVAPAAWIRRHPREARRYDAALPLEEVAAWLTGRVDRLLESPNPFAAELAKRLQWRADILSGKLYQRAVYESLHSADLTRWNEDAANVIEAHNGLLLEVGPRQTSSGRTKAARFIRFEERLTPYPGGAEPTLRLKTMNAHKPARVSLELSSFQHDAELQQAAKKQGFSVEMTDRSTLMISHSSSAMANLTISASVKEQQVAIEAAAEAAQELIEWWEHSLAS